MKKIYSILLALCAVCGMTFAQTEPTVIFTDNFAEEVTDGNSTSTTGQNEVTSLTGFDSLTKVYKAGGAVKLGTGSSAGAMTTQPLDLSVNGGVYHVALTVKGWTNVEGQIEVTPSGASAQSKSYKAKMSDEFETLDFAFTGGAANTAITIATTAKRAFIGSVKVYYIEGQTAEDLNNDDPSQGGDDPEPQLDLEGDGSAAKAYTVADAQKLGTSGKLVWVKAYIVGFAQSSGNGAFADKCVFGTEGAVASNILLADAARENDAAMVVPVQLPAANTAARGALNLADNPDNLGKLVWVNATVESYFGVIGLRNTADYSFTQPEEEAPIETVSTTAEAHDAEVGTELKVEGLVVATYPNGFLLADAAGYITVYQGKAPEFALNDKVSVVGKVEAYNGMKQFGKTAEVTKLEGTDEWNAPAPQVLDATSLAALHENLVITYAEIAGTLTIDKEKGYKNLIIEGTDIKGSLQITDALLGNATNNAKVKVTGFYVWNSEKEVKDDAGQVVGKDLYANFIVTKLEITEAGDQVQTYTTIADLKRAALATDSEANAIECFFNATNLLVTFINGSYIYLSDGTAGTLLYNKTKAAIPAEIKEGNIVSFNSKGNLYRYHGQTELNVTALTDVTVVSENNAIEAKVVTAEELKNTPADYENLLIKVAGLVPSATEWDTQRVIPAVYEIDESNEVNIDIRDNFKTLTNLRFITTEQYTVTGFFAPYDETFRLSPRTEDDVEGKRFVYEAEGEGTVEKPYTVADVKGLSAAGEDAPKGWVRGFIVGYVNGGVTEKGCFFSATIPEDANENVGLTNLLLAADSAETDFNKVIPVELKSEEVRTALSLRSKPENYKVEVLVNGTLTPYFSTPGVKTVTEFQLLTDENPEAIHGISVAGKLDAIFTIAGQRVVRMAKPGLFIVGGKKVLMK